MIFLIEYNRSEGKIITFQDFEDSQRRNAEEKRLEIELGLNRTGMDNEVILLEAQSKDELRKTHRRYFGDFEPIEKSSDIFAEKTESSI